MRLVMERVLLLNQSYEPISVINWQKAISLLVLDKVEVIEEYEGKNIRSKHIVFRMPAVVRLLKAFRRPRKRVKFNKTNVLARDNWKCCYCGQKFSTSELTYDHVIPRSKGGKTTWNNIVSCCINCNSKKGSRSLNESGMRLRKKPTRPDWVPIFSITLSRKKIPKIWKEFCFHS